MSDECPYCGKEVEICHDDGYGMQEDEVFSETCHECGKTFAYTTTISVDHNLNKADCLNGKEHKYVVVRTFPKRYSKNRCEDCGDERPLTFEEMEELFKSSKNVEIRCPSALKGGSFVKITVKGSSEPIYGGICKRGMFYDSTELYWHVNPVFPATDGNNIVIAKDGGAEFFDPYMSITEIQE